MKKRIVIFAGGAAGLAAFFIFRWATQPIETALVWLLLLAFVGSGLLCAALFMLFCQQIQGRWLRLTSIPFFLVTFVFLFGFGVFSVTRIVFDSRPRSGDSGGILYAATSGMQMEALNGDLWFYVTRAAALPLWMWSVITAIVAFTGMHKSPIGKGTVCVAANM